MPNRSRRSLLLLCILVLASLTSFSPQAAAQPAETEATEVAPAAVQKDKVRLSLMASSPSVAAGDVVALAVVLDFDQGWHAWPSAAQDVLPQEIAEFAIRTDAVLADPPPAWAAPGTNQWPEPKPAQVADINDPKKKVTVPLYKDRSVIFLPIRIAADAPRGTQRLTIAVAYQACDDKMCLQPEDVLLSVPIEILAPGTTASKPDDATAKIFAGMKPETLASAKSATKASVPEQPAATPDPAKPAAVAMQTPPGSSFFGINLASLADSPLGWVMLALLGAVGGFILNLTPCVLPVIPIKILTLTQHAGSSRRSFVLGVWMALGVVAFWLGLGIPAAFVAGFADPSIMFGIWWLTSLIGVVIGVMGLGIMGLFNITLPQKVYSVNPEADSPAGSFFFGVMTAVLGLPCFGFVAGALLPVAATVGPAITITVFAAMGVGMAAPYLVLAARPSLLQKMPRTGPASDLIKHVMGLLLLAAAAYFIGSGMIALVQDHPYIGKRLHWWAAAIFGALSGLLLIIRTFQITPSAFKRLVFTLVGVVIAAGGLFVAWTQTSQARADYLATEAQRESIASMDPGTIPTGVWIDYSPQTVDRALAQGKTVVMDFTAEWCLNCKTLKAAVLDVEPVRSAFKDQNTVLVEVDLTSRKAKGWDKLRAYGQTGIPLLVIQGPGTKDPWLSNAYTSSQVLEALSTARSAPR
jgi:thiol:disulfide interchange protein